jgi:hypothetical protein
MTRSANVYDLPNNLKPSGCPDYYSPLMQRSWVKIGGLLNSATHGHLHEIIGGSFGFLHQLQVASYSTATYSAYDGMYQFMHNAEKHSKILWRLGYMDCPTYGTSEAGCPYRANNRHFRPIPAGNSEDTCRCSCSKAMYPTASSDKSLGKIFYETGILKDLIFYDVRRNVEISDILTKIEEAQMKGELEEDEYDTISGYSKTESFVILEEVRDHLCDMGRIGDMFQATSPNDITFWVLHPNMERVWHLSRINTQLGMISFNETWDNNINTCVGHRTTDATPFKGLFGESSSKMKVYTNEELYEKLDPNNPDLPYVYDNFRYYHCEVLGKFDVLLWSHHDWPNTFLYLSIFFFF